MWFLLQLTFAFGIIMLPFILYWEVGIPIIITAPLWYIVIPYIIIRWVTKIGENERVAFGQHLMPKEVDAVSDFGKSFYRQFIENCTKCCAFADGSVHVVVRACGEHGEWLKREARPEYFAFELGYSGPVIMTVFEGSIGSYERYEDERHEYAANDYVALRIIWPKYMLTKQEGNNSEQILRYFAVLSNYFAEKSSTIEKYSFMRGYKIDLCSNESRRLFQFFICNE